MSRYVDVDKLISDIAHESGYTFTKPEIISGLKDYPTADVKPILRGEWILSPRFPHSVKCSICGRLEGLPFSRNTKEYAIENYPFCHCGADMRGENNV